MGDIDQIASTSTSNGQVTAPRRRFRLFSARRGKFTVRLNTTTATSSNCEAASNDGGSSNVNNNSVRIAPADKEAVIREQEETIRALAAANKRLEEEKRWVQNPCCAALFLASNAMCPKMSGLKLHPT